jgi:hypothetical protein
MGRDVALRQAYEYYNESHIAYELDCNPEEVFKHAMEMDGEVLAEVGIMEVGATPRKLRYRILPVGGISKEVTPFEHVMEPEEPVPKKKPLAKKGKPAKTRVDEEAENWDENDDEEEQEFDSELEEEHEDDEGP